MTKVCHRCGRQLPATSEWFPWVGRSDRLRTVCRECNRRPVVRRSIVDHPLYQEARQMLLDDLQDLWPEWVSSHVLAVGVQPFFPIGLAGVKQILQLLRREQKIDFYVSRYRARGPHEETNSGCCQRQ